MTTGKRGVIRRALTRHRVLHGGTYNLEISRDVDVVVAEVVTLMREQDLDFLTVCEASTYVGALVKSARRGGQLHKAGCRVLAYPRRGIPARETAIVVRRRAHGGPGARWKRLHWITRLKWERSPNNRGKGMGDHPGRRSVSAWVAWCRVLAVHTTPGPFGPEYPKRHAANLDCFAHQTRIAKRWAGSLFSRRAVMPGDWNRHPNDPVVADMVDATGWSTHGDGIDWVLAHGVHVSNMRRIKFGGSDHDPVLFDLEPA